MLEALLEVALDLALGLPDAAGHLPQAADENLAEQDEQRGDEHQQRGEPPFHRAEEDDGGDHLERRGEDLRDVGDDDVRDGAHVGFEAVHGVAGVPLLLPQPFGIEQVGVEALPDDEVHLGVREVFHPDTDGGDHEAEDDDAEDDGRPQAQAACHGAGGDVHQPLAQEHEIQVQAHVQGAQQDVRQDRPPSTHGVRPQPAHIFKYSFHSPFLREHPEVPQPVGHDEAP